MSDIDYMIECISKDLVLFLIEDFDVDMQTALRMLYTSDTFAKLQDIKSGLYFQSSRYVYDFLKNEITTGKMS